MTKETLLKLVSGIRLGAEALQEAQPEIGDLKNSIDAVIEALKPILPKKDDGTDYTTEELHAHAMGIEAKADALIRMNAAGNEDDMA